MAKGKEHINLVFIGHVDHGKSTTVGRLLYDSKTIDEATMRKLKEKRFVSLDLFFHERGSPLS